MVFGKTEFLFWGWLKAFLGFEFYKVVAAATMSVMSHLLITYLTSGAMNVDDPEAIVTSDAGPTDVVFRRRLHSAKDPRDDGDAVLRSYRRS